MPQRAHQLLDLHAARGVAARLDPLVLDGLTKANAATLAQRCVCGQALHETQPQVVDVGLEHQQRRRSKPLKPVDLTSSSFCEMPAAGTRLATRAS
jgi:hypothetical protein